MLCGETYGNNGCFEKDESIIDVISNVFGDISGFDKILVLDEAGAYMKKFNTTGIRLYNYYLTLDEMRQCDLYQQVVKKLGEVIFESMPLQQSEAEEKIRML